MNRPTPSSFARKLLMFFLKDTLAEEVQGDLDEKFLHDLKSRSAYRAQLNYWHEVINYLRPFAIKKISMVITNPGGMYKNYLKSSFRTFLRGKLHASINILGLTTGLSVTILLALWLWDEITFNNYHDNHARIGRVLQNLENNGQVQTWTNMPYPLANELRQNYHQDFKRIVMGSSIWDHELVVDDKSFSKAGILLEPGGPELLSLKLKAGTYDGFDTPSSILLSESTAIALYGDQDPINQTVKFDGEIDVKVIGVYEDIPENSSFGELEFIAPFQIFYDYYGLRNVNDPWRPNFAALYVELAEASTFVDASYRIKDAKLKKLNEELAKKKPQLFIHPMDKWHLYAEFENGVNTGGRVRYVWLFGIICVFVLGMACINFMNLSTARSERRSKEIGIRKALGSLRTQLLQQFFTESLLMSLVSFALSLGIVYAVLPYFNQIAGKNLIIFWNEPLFWLICIIQVLLTGLLAGSYPAIYLSSINSIRALKGTFKVGKGSIAPRKVLVIVQFVVSICLIYGTLVVYYQIEYARNRPVGYHRDGLIVVQNQISTDQVLAMQHDLKSGRVITSGCMIQGGITYRSGSSSGIKWPGMDPDLSVDFQFNGISHDFGKTIGWEIVEGRDFSSEFPSDSSALIINEAMANYIGIKNIVGETITWLDRPMKVVGITKDIIVDSPYESVRPHFYFITQSNNFSILRINPEISLQAAIAKTEEIFRKYNPGTPFSYDFISDEYSRKFSGEERIGELSAMFSSLAIFISLLGMLGLASFEAEKRTKEIGIRKVVGASLFALWRLLTFDFVRLILVSSLISVPICYFGLNSWLQNYEYHTSLPWSLFVVSLISVLLITLFVVSFQAIKAAKLNPASTLRIE